MVAKINKGSSLHSALSYNEEKVKEQQAKVLFSNRVMLNRDGSSNMYLTNLSFTPYLNANKNTEKPVLHISINPHPDDEVSDDMYSEMVLRWEKSFLLMFSMNYLRMRVRRSKIYIILIRILIGKAIS